MAVDLRKTISTQLTIAERSGIVVVMIIDPSNDQNALPGTTAAQDGTLPGTVQVDDLVQATFPGRSGSPPLVLECQARVVRSSYDRTLHFYFRIRKVVSGPTPRIWAFDWFAFDQGGPVPQVIEADWRPDGMGTLAPVEAAFGSPVLTVRFSHGDRDAPRLPRDDGTRFVYVKTIGRRFARTDQGVIIQMPREDDLGLETNSATVPGFYRIR